MEDQLLNTVLRAGLMSGRAALVSTQPHSLWTYTANDTLIPASDACQRRVGPQTNLGRQRLTTLCTSE